MDLDVLLAVQQHRAVVGEARHVGEPAHRAGAPRARGHPARRDHREARQHLEVLLVGVFELGGVGGARARADPEVIEDHVVGPVAARALAEIGAERLFAIDRHVVS